MKRIVFALVADRRAGRHESPTWLPHLDRPMERPLRSTESKFPHGYRDWRLISVNHLAGGNLKQVRAQLGNDVAIKAFREGKLPFPDGTIIAALHWNEASSDENNKVLAIGFPGAGLQSSVAGSAVNVQFMVKDSKKYAATGGWGFADFTNGKPGNEALHKTCFPCHEPAKDRDYVFTRYAP